MSLKTKFLNVMKSCAYVQKLGENTFHRYKYATAADVFDKVNTALVEQGIISVAKPVILATEQVTTTKGNIETRVTVEMTVALTDTVTGEIMTLTAFGSGQDTGDKAVMKAQTAALKYCYMMSLNISTGDDPEADVSVDARMEAAKQVPQPVTPEALKAGAASTQEKNILVPEVAASKQTSAQAANQKVTPEQLKIIFVLGRRAGIADELMRDRIHRTYHVTSSRELSKGQASALIDELKAEVNVADKAG